MIIANRFIFIYICETNMNGMYLSYLQVDFQDKTQISLE